MNSRFTCSGQTVNLKNVHGVSWGNQPRFLSRPGVCVSLALLQYYILMLNIFFRQTATGTGTGTKTRARMCLKRTSPGSWRSWWVAPPTLSSELATRCRGTESRGRFSSAAPTYSHPTASSRTWRSSAPALAAPDTTTTNRRLIPKASFHLVSFHSLLLTAVSSLNFKQL